jgi:hypothetical protein
VASIRAAITAIFAIEIAAGDASACEFVAPSFALVSINVISISGRSWQAVRSPMPDIDSNQL